MDAEHHHGHAGPSLKKALFACGIASSILYVAVDVIAALRSPGYSYASQTISELTAIAAPTRTYVVPFYLLYDELLVLFGLGVWWAARGRRALRVASLLVATEGFVGAVWTWFPMHLRGTPPTATDTMHVVFAGVVSVLILSAIGFSAAAGLGRRFRVYALATIAIMIVAGAATSLFASRIPANLPTPGIGLIERLNVYAYVAWIAALGVAMWREESRHPSVHERAVSARA